MESHPLDCFIKISQNVGHSSKQKCFNWHLYGWNANKLVADNANNNHQLEQSISSLMKERKCRIHCWKQFEHLEILYKEVDNMDGLAHFVVILDHLVCEMISQYNTRWSPWSQQYPLLTCCLLLHPWLMSWWWLSSLYLVLDTLYRQ